MTDRLRFCLVTTFFPPYHFGGDGIFVYRLAEALAELGHSVHVLHSVDAYHLQHPGDPEVRFADHRDVTRFPLESRRPMLSALTAHQLGEPAAYSRRLRRHFSENEYDVIHYHNISLMGGPGILRLGRAVKLYTTHEYWLICPTHVLFTFDREACTQRRCIRCTLHARRPPQFWRYSGLLQECAAHVDRFIMPSRFARDRHLAEGLVGATSILPNFVPVPSAQPEAASGPRTEDPFFLYVGRLEKLKGVQDLIRLFSEYRGARLVIVGTGEHEAVLREQALGMHHVEFLGFVHPAEIPQLYREAIAVLAPSLCYEVFPLSAAEALAQGTPVIARRIGALAELLEESGGGLTFETLPECRAAMERLQGDPGLRAELGACGRRTAMEKWTIEVHLAQYLDLVRGLIVKRADGILRSQEPKKYAAVVLS